MPMPCCLGSIYCVREKMKPNEQTENREKTKEKMKPEEETEKPETKGATSENEGGSDSDE